MSLFDNSPKPPEDIPAAEVIKQTPPFQNLPQQPMQAPFQRQSQPQMYAQNPYYSGMMPNGVQMSPMEMEYNWKMMNGTKNMRPQELMYVLTMANTIQYENDYLSEDYYRIRVNESMNPYPESNAPVRAIPTHVEQQIRERIQFDKKISLKKSKEWSNKAHALGVNIRYNIRTPRLLIDVPSLNDTEEDTNENGFKGTQWKLMARIEQGYDALLDIDKIKRREFYNSNNGGKPNPEEYHRFTYAVKALQQAFFLEGEDNNFTVKNKSLIKLMKHIKGKKLLVEAEPYLCPSCWKVILGVLLPYILLWLDTTNKWTENDQEVNTNIVNCIQSVIDSDIVNLDVVTSTLLNILASETAQMIPDFLATEPYATIFTAFFNKGDTLAMTPSFDASEDVKLAAENWTILMGELENVLTSMNS
ncbi:hypothetical protein WA158_001841 [Blastocystis sp. Blastoise]